MKYFKKDWNDSPEAKEAFLAGKVKRSIHNENLDRLAQHRILTIMECTDDIKHY